MSVLAAKARRLPRESGVYLFKDTDGAVLYVGKAADLRARVGQYLTGSDDRVKVRFLLSAATDVDVMITHTEKEALILENTLIKRYAPRYNTQLRDDKNFLHIQLDSRGQWPRFRLVRRIQGNQVYGPYHSAKKARKTLEFLHKAFPLRTCSDRVLASRQRPCLLHQLDRCVAPCVEGHTTQEDYNQLVTDALAFLEGRREDVVKSLYQRMRRASNDESFEQAARLRDLAATLSQTLEEQKVVDKRLSNRDVWAWYREGQTGITCVLPVRGGRMLDPAWFTFEDVIESQEELISSWLNHWYSAEAEIPPEILLPLSPLDSSALEEVLTERCGRKVKFRVPQRGEKQRLVDLAIRNAKDRFRRTTNQEARLSRALEDLARIAKLPGPPRRMECFDNSNLRGKQPVGAQVVFLDGKPAKKEYRTYRIQQAAGDDDYGSMREVLGRRLRRAWKDGVFPDLIVVDGGRGQLNAALEVLEDLGLEELPIMGLAKPRTEKKKGLKAPVDKILLPDVPGPIRLEDHDPVLNLLRHLRDESHRFAIQFHRKSRRKAALTSRLDSIGGVGPARRRALLRHFGSLKAIHAATVSEIQAVDGVGPQLAASIHQALKRG